MEVETGFEPVYTALQAVASPLGHSTERGPLADPLLRADDGIRTRDPHLGKVMLYQLSHVRVISVRLPAFSCGPRPGDVLNSSGFRAQLKFRIPCMPQAGPRPRAVPPAET